MKYKLNLLLFLTTLLPAIALGNTFLINATAIAMSSAEAKEEAVGNLIQKTMQAHREFHLSSKLNQQDSNGTTVNYPMAVDEWFISPIIEKAISKAVNTNRSKKGDYTQLTVGLTADGVRNIYRQTINYFDDTIKKNDLEQLKLRFWTASQLEYFLRAFSTDAILELQQMQSYANIQAVKFAENMTIGSVTFAGVTDDMTIILNNEFYSTATVQLFPGKYNFSAIRPTYYPLHGILSIQPRDNQLIELPMIKEPKINPRVYLSTNLPGNLMPYIRRTLDSYGWKIDTKASAALKIDMKRERVIKDSSVYVYSLALNYEVNSKKIAKDQYPEQILRAERYTSSVDIGKNDIASSLREQRILVIQSLIQFLSLFNQQDFELLSAIEE